jgi:preprotein translocase subunit SecG
MSALLIVLHIVVCIALIMIVLLQTGKGADMGAAFGGGASQTLFGSTGASTFLSKATTVAAIVFMLTSLGLAYMSGSQPQSSIMLETKAPIESPSTAEKSEASGKQEHPATSEADQTNQSSTEK